MTIARDPLGQSRRNKSEQWIRAGGQSKPMKRFHCDDCGMKVLFENDRCVKCGHTLGFLPEIMALKALETASRNLWQACAADTAGRAYRQCANGQQHQICNWMVPETDPNPFCVACQLNQVIPNLTGGKNIERWKKLKLTKRRCVYLFLKLGLPLDGVAGGDLAGLRFCFLEDTGTADVKTGHQRGVITGNVANNGSEIAPIRFKEHMDLERLLTDWVPLICALNSFNRGMGLSDLYPFVISPAVTEKLRLIHLVIQETGSAPATSASTGTGGPELGTATEVCPSRQL